MRGQGEGKRRVGRKYGDRQRGDWPKKEGRVQPRVQMHLFLMNGHVTKKACLLNRTTPSHPRLGLNSVFLGQKKALREQHNCLLSAHPSCLPTFPSFLLILFLSNPNQHVSFLWGSLFPSFISSNRTADRVNLKPSLNASRVSFWEALSTHDATLAAG